MLRFKQLLAIFCASIAISVAAQNVTPSPTPTTSVAQTQPAPAPTTHDPGYIIVVQVTGEVYVLKQDENLRFALRNGSVLNARQRVITGPKASVMLAFSNGATVTVGENAFLSIDELTQKPFGEMFRMAEATKEPSSSTTRLNLLRGEIISNVKKLNKAEGSLFEIKTPVGIAGIRGTTFRIAYTPPPPTAAQSGIINTDDAPSASEASFALMMLEGTIEMRIPGAPQPIVVPQGKQLVLDNLITDSATGETLVARSSPAKPANVEPGVQALLLQNVQTMIGAAGDLAMPTSAAMTSTMQGGHDQLPTLPSGKNNSAGGTKDTPDNSSDSGLPQAPAPQAPTPRLSPTDGTGAN